MSSGNIKNLTCQDSTMPSTNMTMMETESNQFDNSAKFLLSNDPRVKGLTDTPPPAICKFCGAEQYAEGLPFAGRVLWFHITKPCKCPEGQEKYKQEQADQEALMAYAEKAKADMKMREKVRRVINESGMGERFLQRTFQTFVIDTPHRRKIMAAAQEYVRDFDLQVPKQGEPLLERNGFMITGAKGTGKTHIAAAIANYLLNIGTAVICITERNLFDRIRRTYSEHGDESAVRIVYETVPLLIIDDLGKEKPTEWTLATLYAIIDGRYDRAMPIVVTTNYDEDSLVRRLTPAGEDKTTAEAIVDRLAEMCKSIVMTGDSWRLR